MIQELEDKRYAAVLNQDYDTFEGLCHADLVYGHTGGNRDSLETYISKLRSGVLLYHRIDHPVENIVLVGDAALVTGQMSADLTINGSNKTLNNSWHDATFWPMLDRIRSKPWGFSECINEGSHKDHRPSFRPSTDPGFSDFLAELGATAAPE